MDMAMSSLSSISSAMATMSMEMSSMSMDMASSTAMAMGTAMATATSAAASASSTGHSMGGMGGMSMGGSSSSSGAACKISMLWNWYTIDACFISRGWHVKTRGMFAGTCIGVFCWVVALVLLQRMHREFDRYIVRQWARGREAANIHGSAGPVDVSSNSSMSKMKSLMNWHSSSPEQFHPNLWQQLVRACLYTVEFGAGYLLMLMAMYYNGYIMITMWLGALFGFFMFGADTVSSDLTRARATCC